MPVNPKKLSKRKAEAAAAAAAVVHVRSIAYVTSRRLILSR
jgi:hypothetical protein